MLKTLPYYQDHLTDIVWLQTAFLGDMILSLAACQAARAFFPKARQHLITTKIGSEALKHQGFTSVITFEKRGANPLTAMLHVRKQLRANLPERSKQAAETVMLQVHRSFRSSLLAKLCGLPTITYQEASASWLAHARIDRVAPLHEATRVALLLQGLGVPRRALLGLRPEWRAHESERLNPANEEAFLRVKGSALVGIAPGSVWGTKRWPISSYIDLVERILSHAPTHGVVLLGSHDELSYAKLLVDRFKAEPRVLPLIGKTTLAELPAIYRSLRVLVSNDSSPVHYASASNTPTVTIFGATTPELGFGPLADQARVVQVDGLACRPCSDHGPMVCPLGHFRCMRDLSVASVFDKLLPLL